MLYSKKTLQIDRKSLKTHGSKTGIYTDLVDPDVLAVFGVEGSLLERAEFESQPRPQFLETDLLCSPEYVPANT